MYGINTASGSGATANGAQAVPMGVDSAHNKLFGSPQVSFANAASAKAFLWFSLLFHSLFWLNAI